MTKFKMIFMYADEIDKEQVVTGMRTAQQIADEYVTQKVEDGYWDACVIIKEDDWFAETRFVRVQDCDGDLCWRKYDRMRNIVFLKRNETEELKQFLAE